MDAYRDLADHSPTVADLQLTAPPTPPARRRATTLAVLGALIAVIAIVASVVYLRSHASGKHEPPANVPQPRWPDSYSFGSDSLPGYTLTRTDMQVPGGAPAASTTYTYAKRNTNMQATLAVLRASNLGQYRDGTPVTVNGRRGYYQTGPASLPPPPPARPTSIPAPTGSRSARPPLVPPLSSAITWPTSKDSWAVLTEGPASINYVNGKLQTPAAIPSQAVMVDLAESVRVRESPTVAPVKVGYLPPNLELSSVQQFLESPVSTFDNRFGISYRDLMFVERSANRSQLFTLDVGALVTPQKPLELKRLPDARTVLTGNWSPTPYDPAKQWTQTTIAGHRAFVSAHDVIVDWAESRCTSRRKLPIRGQAGPEPAGTDPDRGIAHRAAIREHRQRLPPQSGCARSQPPLTWALPAAGPRGHRRPHPCGPGRGRRPAWRPILRRGTRGFVMASTAPSRRSHVQQGDHGLLAPRCWPVPAW